MTTYYDIARLARILLDFAPIETASFLPEEVSKTIDLIIKQEESLKKNSTLPLPISNASEFDLVPAKYQSKEITHFVEQVVPTVPTLAINTTNINNLLSFNGVIGFTIGVLNGTTFTTTPNMEQCLSSASTIYNGILSTYNFLLTITTVAGIF